MEKRFRILRVIATVYKALAWISLVGGILVGLALLALAALGGGAGSSYSYGYNSGPSALLGPLMGGILGGLVLLVMWVIMGVLSFVAWYAAGEVISLGLAIEENTRETAYYLKGGSGGLTNPL